MKDFFVKHDLLNKLLAVSVAVVMWAIVTNIKNPIEQVWHNDLVAEFSSINFIEDTYNLVIISDEFPKVNIKVKGTSDDLLRVTPSNIKVSADLSGITKAGSYQIDYSIKLPFSGIEVVNKYPDKLSITVDEISVKQVPLEVEFVGTAEKGYSYNLPKIDSEIKVSGPLTELNKISRAVVYIDIDNKSDDISKSFEILLKDASDKKVSSDEITQSEKEVDIAIIALKTKEVPLEVELNFGTTVKEKSINGYKVEPETIQITGRSSVVDAINSINLGTINVDDSFESESIIFALPKNDNITYGFNDAVKTSLIKTDYTNQKYDVTNFEIDDEIIERIEIKTDVINVELFAFVADLGSIDADDIKIIPNINLDVLPVGIHEVETTVVINSEKDFDIYDSYKMKVEVK